MVDWGSENRGGRNDYILLLRGEDKLISMYVDSIIIVCALRSSVVGGKERLDSFSRITRITGWAGIITVLSDLHIAILTMAI